MKAERKNYKFDPVILTLETQEEVDKMFAIFNCSRIVEALDAGVFTNKHAWYKELMPFKDEECSTKWHAKLAEVTK